MKWCLVAGLWLSVSCVSPSTMTCDDGLVCPSGYVCDAAHRGCALPSQVAACVAKPAFEPCSYTGVAVGACFDGVCLPAGCGNGMLEPDEACDDSNRFHNDGCSADCRSTEVCGNGVLDAPLGEACDDGNLVDGDATGCQSTCKVAGCGDGIPDPSFNEACDKGADNSNEPDAECRPNCQARRCGDGTTDSTEVCDDGNLLSADGCTFDCLSDETCGNGYPDYVRGELCDDGNDLVHDGCTECQLETASWRQVSPSTPSARFSPAITYDAARGTIVVFGGQTPGVYSNETWTWDGTAWFDVTPATGNPDLRASAAIVYDAARRRVVMFGGFVPGFGQTNDTWEWNGTAWRNVTPAGAKPVARTTAMAYDAARKRVVLFGGQGFGGTRHNDTWEWNGTTWTNVTPASGNPRARALHGLAYDPRRKRVVMFGGEDATGGSVRLDDTWEWDGTTWENVTPSSGNPPPHSRHAMAFDARSGYVTMFGGITSNGTSTDVWEWTGEAWDNVTPSVGGPTQRWDTAFAFDTARNQMVLFGGRTSSTTFDETWLWTGAWGTPTALPATVPREQHASAYDTSRGEVVVFGGVDDTAEEVGTTLVWSGHAWRDATPGSNNPPARRLHAMAYDPVRDRVVLFAGSGGLGDTWEWNGSAWEPKTPATSPSTRTEHSLTYDTRRKRIVLVGGFDGVNLDDVWEWDGTDWTQVTPVTASPPVRRAHGAAYDEVRGKLVIYGGVDALSLGDTWEGEWMLDGFHWTDVTPAQSNPIARYATSLVYDATRGRVVLFAGHAPYRDDTWEWDGSAWTQATMTTMPAARRYTTFTYDRVRSASVMFGGDGPTTFDDTWRFRHERSDGPVDGCYHGIDGDNDGKIGCDDPDCFGACSPMCNSALQATCDAAWPRCGDGSCQTVETARLCPADCGVPTALCGDHVCDASENATDCPGDCTP